jgi:hypothetical protein
MNVILLSLVSLLVHALRQVLALTLAVLQIDAQPVVNAQMQINALVAIPVSLIALAVALVLTAFAEMNVRTLMALLGAVLTPIVVLRL